MKIVEYSKGSITEVENVFKVVESGAQGLQGVDGTDGTNGINGTNGTDGADGIFSEIASQAEALAGTDNTKGMTPLRVVESIGGPRTLGPYSETNNTVTAGATETIPTTHRNHSYTLTEACLFTAPTLPAAGVRDSHVVDIASETFATSWAASPAIRWATSDNLPPTFDTTAGTESTVTLRANAAGTFWQGRTGGETVAP